MPILAILALLVATLATYAVLARRVRDGIVIKSGLICIAVGSAALVPHLLVPTEASGQAVQRALAVCAAGLVIAAVGLWRRLHLGERLRHFIEPEHDT